MTNSTLTLQEKIDLVKKDLLTRFPNCAHTVKILLWDDGTDAVECRHGDDNGQIHYSQYYNNELTFTTFDNDNRVMKMDEFGISHHMYLVKEKPNNNK